MKFTERLYQDTEDIWEKYYSHPFIKGIEEGTLDKEKFKFYMIQDYIYLWDYSKLFALGALKAEKSDLIAMFARSLDSTINVEMGIHRDYMADLGITEEEVENERTSLLNTSYTNYMLSVSQKGGLIEVVAAILSCAWTYAEIANHIHRNNPKAREHEFYGRWVEGYISSEFQEIAQFYLDLINDMAENLNDESKDYLSEIFRNCCIYELRFWDMSYQQSYEIQV